MKGQIMSKNKFSHTTLCNSQMMESFSKQIRKLIRQCCSKGYYIIPHQRKKKKNIDVNNHPVVMRTSKQLLYDLLSFHHFFCVNIVYGIVQLWHTKINKYIRKKS